MMIMALDLGWDTGFCFGEAGVIPPEIRTIRLKRPSEDREVAIRNLGCFLRDRLTMDRPDIICVEHWLHPTAQKSGDAVIAQMLLHGALLGVAGCCGCRIEAPHAATVRAHFLGKARMGTRDETKAAMINRAVLLGYLPRGCASHDKADAAGIFDFASATHGRARPSPLVLFGETFHG